VNKTLTTAVASLLLVFSGIATADSPYAVYKSEAAFEDVMQGLKMAIEEQGLYINNMMHMGEMLERTREDTGSDVVLFDEADIYLFCSAVVSREVMEADPMNIANCPYGIFVAEREGEVMIGYRAMPEESMAPVQDLLDEIAREAAGQ